MSNYTKTKDFAAADALPSGSAAKAIKGTDLGLEYDNIATAIATKLDIASAVSAVVGTGVATLNAASIAVGQTYTVWRSAANAIISNAALTADTVLQLLNLPIGNYAFNSNARVVNSATGVGLGAQFAGLSGSLLAYATGQLIAGGAGGTAYQVGAATGAELFSNNGGSPSTLYYAVQAAGFVSVTTAGNFGLKWAQGVSTASNSSIQAGSYLSITRLS